MNGELRQAFSDFEAMAKSLRDEAAESKQPAKPKPAPPERHPISDDHRAKLLSLAGVTCLPGSFDKRFIRNLQGATELTEKQAALVDKMVHRYRRQITGKA